MKRTFLELGGKSANIMLDDADFDTSLLSGLAVCFHAGQGCAIPTRMLLPRSRYDEGVEKLKEYMRMAPYGDPQRPDVMMGPLISEKQRERVLGYIEKGKAEGATLALGGGRPAGLPKGWYVEPTMFVDVDNSMTIAREEIFGPVLSVIPVKDAEQALTVANDTIYGLASAIFTADINKAFKFAKGLRAGSVWVNTYDGGDITTPFGGYKQSGIGRDKSLHAFDKFTQVKTTWIQLG